VYRAIGTKLVEKLTLLSDWCSGHMFESHSESLLLTHPDEVSYRGFNPN